MASPSPAFIFVGQVTRSQLMADAVTEHLGIDAYAVCRLSDASLPVLRALLGPAHLVRVGFRPGAPTIRGIAFDLLWTWLRTLRTLLKAPGRYAFIWNGSDVLNQLKDHATGQLRRRVVRRSARNSMHMTAAPWLAEELRTLNIESSYCPLPLQHWPKDIGRLPKASFEPQGPLQVCSYVNPSKPDFYGHDTLVELAKALPSVRFSIIGSEKPSRGSEPPANLGYHGWIDDTPAFLSRHHLLLRLVPHDGMPQSVLQALLVAAHAICTVPVQTAMVVKHDDLPTLYRLLGRLERRLVEGALLPNNEGHDYVRTEHDPEANIRAFTLRFSSDGGHDLG